MKEELKQIISDIMDACESCVINVDDNTILENAVRIYNTQYIQEGKKENIKQMNSNPPIKPITRTEEPATEKQKELMKKLGITITAGLTKKEAWKKINEVKEK